MQSYFYYIDSRGGFQVNFICKHYILYIISRFCFKDLILLEVS